MQFLAIWILKPHGDDVLQVHIIAIVQRSEKVDYRCHLLCQKEVHVSKGSCFIHSDHFGFPYGTAGIVCPIPQGCETPSQITLTSAAERNHGKLLLCFDAGLLQNTDMNTLGWFL